MYRALTALTVWLLWSTPALALSGQVVTLEFHSEIMENTRTLWVYLPPDYAESDTRYPVFYLQDGQNLMDGETAHKRGHEWGVDETADQLINEGKTKPVILVGIGHAGKNRAYEYNVKIEKSQGAGPFFNQGGGGELYGYMMTEELMPLINKTFRTLTEPKNTAVGGASFGCNISLYLALEYPEYFGNAMAMSCSTWFANQWLNRTVRAIHKKPKVKIWLDVGDREFDDDGWNEAEVFRHAQLYDSFIARGWQKNKDILFLVEKGGQHFEDDWARRFPMALTWFFGQDDVINQTD